jgi:hypothetical protein
MREQPRGALARATAIAEGIAVAVRRRQRDRAPRIVLYERPGSPRILAPGAKGYDEMLDVAEQMVTAAKPANSGVERKKPRS